MRNLQSEILLVLRDIAIGFVSIVTLILTIIQFSQLFGVDFALLQSLGGVGVYLGGIHALIGSLVYAIWMLARRWLQYKEDNLNLEQSEKEGALKLSVELAKVVEHSYKTRSYRDVVRFGSEISRPLFLSGMYMERVKIGEMIEDSAARVGASEEQIAALIDDIGWTSALLGDLSKADRAIMDGVRLAVEKEMYYLAAKGERHLAGIYLRYKNDVEGAVSHFSLATEYARKITNEVKRDEMLAGILYGHAEQHLNMKNYPQALQYAEESRQLYGKLGNEEERLVKLYSLIGGAYLGLSEIQKAKDAFRNGLEEAQRLQRRDEIARNLFGLGEACLLSEEFQRAVESLSEAQEIFQEVGMKQEAHKARALKTKAEVELKSR